MNPQQYSEERTVHEGKNGGTFTSFWKIHNIIIVSRRLIFACSLRDALNLVNTTEDLMPYVSSV